MSEAVSLMRKRYRGRHLSPTLYARPREGINSGDNHDDVALTCLAMGLPPASFSMYRYIALQMYTSRSVRGPTCQLQGSCFVPQTEQATRGAIIANRYLGS